MLLLPYSTDSCHFGSRCEVSSARRSKGKSLSPLMCYTCQPLQIPTKFNTFLRGGRRFGQYIVDQYCKGQSERLKYLRENEHMLWGVDNTARCDLLSNSGSTEHKTYALKASGFFSLPSSHVSGDRYMGQNMHDIISVSNIVGSPDMSLTMTYIPQ